MPRLRRLEIAKGRGPLFWWRLGNLVASRRKILRPDSSNLWRYAFENANPPTDRSQSFGELLGRGPHPGRFRFVVLGDTGEGDRSQYSLLPLLWAAKPDFMIINGDVAYPAGDIEDFREGFFQPYANMGIPIWATAGNHEYYSKFNGREFYQVFCDPTISSGSWSAAGLRFSRQPGMYWELRDPSGDTNLVVLGLDSGQAGNLAGHTSWLRRTVGKPQPPDDKQHAWLRDRLELAEGRGDSVMILFHIPGMVSGKAENDVYLQEVHRILAERACVKLVVCGHIHNHQQYEPDVFRRYLEQACQATPLQHAPPHYVVNGNGGATIDGTAKIDPQTAGKLDYPVKDVFPEARRWQQQASFGRRVAESFGSGTVLSRTIGAFDDARRGDADTSADNDTDPAGLQSFLIVDVAPGTAPVVSLVAMDSLLALFSQQPDDKVIDIAGPSAALLDPDALDRCTTKLFEL